MDTHHSPLPDERDYRVISYARDGRVVAIKPLSAQCDADAIAQADAWVRESAADLWDGLRFVEHFAGRHILKGCLLAATVLAGG